MLRDERQSRPANVSPAILVASEVRLFGEALAKILSAESTLSVRGYCLVADELILRTASVKPDIVLLDAAFRRGAELVARLRKAAPRIVVVVIALTETVDSVIEWVEAGAAGYIPNTAALADVPRIVVGISRGEQACLPSVAAGLIRRLHEHPVNPPADDAGLPSLTARETQIADLIGAGLSNKEIARRLNIGLSTTKSHVHNLLGKLQVQQRAQAAVRLRQASLSL